MAMTLGPNPGDMPGAVEPSSRCCCDYLSALATVGVTSTDADSLCCCYELVGNYD